MTKLFNSHTCPLSLWATQFNEIKLFDTYIPSNVVYFVTIMIGDIQDRFPLFVLGHLIFIHYEN